jgi:5'-nucleotidase
MKKSILYIDMDDVLCQFSEAQTKALKQNPAIGFPQSQYGFFRKLKPMENAISSVQRLRESKRFEVYILTAPSIRNPLCYSEKREWVENHLGIKMVERLIISPNKGLNKGDYLIDDHTSGRGQEGFEGKLIHFGSDEFPDWKTVIDYFI